MAAKFEWQTEEEEGWESQPDPEKVVGLSRSRRRWRPWLLAALVVVLLASAAYWQGQRRVVQAEDGQREALLASFNLVRQAAERQDRDLLASVIGGDRSWTSDQKRLLDNGWLFDAHVFGLWPHPAGARVVEVSFAPDLRSAEVVVEETYQVVSSDGLTTTVQLQRTDVYRRTDRWLWSSPEDAYWGGPGSESLVGERLVLYYPARDEALAVRLLADLDAVLDRLCREPAANCPGDWQLVVQLMRDVDVLSAMAEEAIRSGVYGRLPGARAAGAAVILPAPSLLGTPVDEAGYQAWRRGYATYVAAAALEERVDSSCCESEEDYTAALQAELAWLELGLWPATLPAPFLAGPLPAQDVALVCRAGFERGFDLYHLNLAGKDWQAVLAGRDVVRIRAVPGERGILVQEQSDVGDGMRTRLYIRRGQAELALYDQVLPLPASIILNWEVAEAQRRLILNAPEIGREFVTHRLYNLAACRDGECPPAVTVALLGRPAWSPDGQRFLTQANDLLWRREGNRQVQLGEGVVPFWIDNEWYGYVFTIEGEQQGVVAASQADDTPRLLLTLDQLLALLPAETRPERLAIGHVELNPANPDQWFILAFGLDAAGSARQAVIFTYNWNGNELQVVLQSEQLNNFSLSPGGRWLATQRYDEGQEAWLLALYDTTDVTAAPRVLSFPSPAQSRPVYDWSADDRWLLVLHQGLLQLYDPAGSQQGVYTPPVPGCSQAVWLNE